MRFSEDRLARLACSDRVERTLHIWTPERPAAVILAIHGGMAHGGDYVTPALFFRAHGVATVSLDLCGHDGKRRVDIPAFGVFLDDALLTLHWIRREFPGLPVFVMGHSMGALIATHLGLGKFAAEPDIAGYILSSPYYVNAIPVPRPLVWLSGLLGRLLPRAKVPLASLTGLLTHDPAITARHYADEQDDIRAREVSFRFAAALGAAQDALRGGLAAWRQPVFAAVAGADKLADAAASEAMLKTIAPDLLEYRFYPHNYHENFNELNRGQIFAEIWRWMERQGCGQAGAGHARPGMPASLA